MGIAGDYVSLPCRGSELLRWLYGLGYHAYATGVKHPLELTEWETIILPLLLNGEFDKLQKDHGIPRIVELMVVHDSAPVPAIFGVNYRHDDLSQNCCSEDDISSVPGTRVCHLFSSG